MRQAPDRRFGRLIQTDGLFSYKPLSFAQIKAADLFLFEEKTHRLFVLCFKKTAFHTVLKSNRAFNIFPRQVTLRSLTAFRKWLRHRGNVGLPIRETRMVAPWALPSIPNAPPACFRHRRRQASVPNLPEGFYPSDSLLRFALIARFYLRIVSDCRSLSRQNPQCQTRRGRCAPR